MKFSDLDLCDVDVSTRARIFETVESLNSFSVFILRTPEQLMHPLTMVSPAETSRKALSPVMALVSMEEEPSTTVPSIGTFSPG